MALPPVAAVYWAVPTAIAGLVLAVLLPSERSVAVMVWEPAVPKVTGKVCVPATRTVLVGKLAAESLEVMPTRSVTVLIRFQFASTPLTVTVNAEPTFWPMGVPVLPVAVPGAAVSAGTNNCNFAKAPTLTVTLELVLAVSVPAASVAVMVRVPAVLKVKLDKVRVPETSVIFPAVAPLSSAIAALPPELVMVTLVPLCGMVTTFQLVSTALTVTLNAVPAVCAVAVPVLPLLDPGEAVSPGTNNCNFVKLPALTVMEGLVLAVLVPSLMSLAVTVRLPAVLSVTLKVCVPATSAAFDGPAIAGSEEVIPTVCVTLVTTFQLASTALTVTLKAPPAV